MSSAYLHKQVSKTKAKKRAWNAYSIYKRTQYTLKGHANCFTCDAKPVLKGRSGVRVMVGHWVEGHRDSTYINDDYVRPQCYRCNMMLGGNQGEFRDRIRKEIGDKKTDKLLADAKKTLDMTASDYLQLQAYYKEKLKRLTDSL